MADNRSSDVITNMTAVPPVLNDPHYAGVLKEVIGRVTPAADDDDDSIHRFVRVPSNARISEVLIAAADASTGGKYDFGVYYPEHVNAGAVISRDCLSAAFDLAGGAYYWTNVMNVTAVTIAESVYPLWQLAGLSSDPGGEFDVCGTIETVFNGAPTSVGLKVRYV